MTTIDEYGVNYSADLATLIRCDNPQGVKETYIIPNGVITIAKEAFKGCNNISKIVIPSSVITIGASAFSGCSKLESIECNTIVPPRCGQHVFNGVDRLKTLINVPQDSLEEYKSAPIWKSFKNISPLESVLYQSALQKNKVATTDKMIIINDSVKHQSSKSNEMMDVMSLTISQFQEEIHPLEPANRALMKYFDNGYSLISYVLYTNVQDFGTKTMNVLKKWREQIKRETSVETVENYEIKELKPHQCVNMPIQLLLEAVYKKNVTPKLLKALEKSGCKTILDLFRFEDPLPKATQQFLEEVKEYVLSHLDDLDRDYCLFLYDSQQHELPDLNKLIQHPLIVKVQEAIKQLCVQWRVKNAAPREIRKINIVESSLLENSSCKQIACELTITDTRVDQIIAEFAQEFMMGSKSSLVQNYYVCQDLIDEITQCSEECTYSNAQTVCEKLGVRSVDELSSYDQILRYIFNLKLASRGADSKCWDDGTSFYIPDYEKKSSIKENVIQPVFDYLKDQYRPLSASDIWQHLAEDETLEHKCLDEIEIFETTLQNYNKVEKIDDGYQLILSDVSDEYKYARIAYEELNGKKRDAVTTQEIETIMIARGISLPCAPKNPASGVIKQWNNVWTLCPVESNQTARLSLYMFIYEYAKTNEVVDISKLLDAIHQNGYAPTRQTVSSLVRRFCIGAEGNSNIYCFETAIANHPEHNWRTQRDGSARNQVLQKVYEFVNQRGTIKASALKDEINKYMDDWGFGMALYDKVLQVYSIHINAKNQQFSNEDDYAFDKPLRLEQIHVGRKGRGGSEFDYLVSINPSFNKDDLEFIGYRSDKQFQTTIIARIIEVLRSAPNQTCDRTELTQACKSLFEDDKKAFNVVHNILYHHLPADKIKWYVDGRKAFYQLISTEEETHEAPVETIAEAAPQIETKQVLPIGVRPEPDKDVFKRELARILQSYRGEWVGNFDRSIEKFVDFMWEAPAKRLGDRLRQYWYEYLSYRVDKYFIYSAYSESLMCYEKYLRVLYERFTGEELSFTNGLVDTMNQIDCMVNWYNLKRDRMRVRIYDSVYKNRNRISHGEDLPQDLNLYVAARDALALYVYTYALMNSYY